ncbi:MAG: hypothetical protein K6E17_01955 [Clostridiales bacterium]|nr:hypothetical protein [Clostridiales bacterium]
MKQLTCEVCGCNDLMKQDGVFVCQACGCKYSLDEVRKMMIEGTVEVQGTVQVANAAQVSNLLKMAHSAFDSKNYAKAEEFCDQAIAMNDKNDDAWALKGEAILHQINKDNPRVLEVNNCFKNAFYSLGDNLDAGEREKRIDKIIQDLKGCLEGNLIYWINQFEAGRPSVASKNKIINSYNETREMIQSDYKEFGRDPQSYLRIFDEWFLIKCNAICVSAWKTTVAYNYFRKDLGNYGASWNRNPNEREYLSSDVFRPAEKIRTTFVDETSCLIELLQFCETLFNENTSPKVKENIYSNIAVFYDIPIKQVSYQYKITTEMNGWGNWVRHEFYYVDRFLTQDSQNYRRKRADDYKAKEAGAIEEGKRKAIERKEAYWKAHAKEKDELTNEKESLKQQIQKLRDEERSIPSRDEITIKREQIESLNAQKKGISLFNGKERKAIQEQIDSLNESMNALIEREKAVVMNKITPLSKRIEEIDAELTKER